MAKKLKPPAERKRTRKPGPDPTVNQVFMKIEQYGTKMFKEWQQSLRGLQEQIAAQLACCVFRLPSWMKMAREQAGISQATLATISGLSPSAIANYESGYAVPTIDNAYRIYGELYQRKSDHAAHALVEITLIYKLSAKSIKDHIVKSTAQWTEHVVTVNSEEQKFDEEIKEYKAFIDAVRKAKG